MRRLLLGLALTGCAGTDDDASSDDTPAPLCPVTGIDRPEPVEEDTALDSGDLDTGLRITAIGTFVSCVRPEEQMEGYLRVHLERKRKGTVLCDLLLPVTSTGVDPACPGCDFAFEVTAGAGELLLRRRVYGALACSLGFGEGPLEVGPEALGVKGATMMHRRDGAWLEFVTLALTLADAGEGEQRLEARFEIPGLDGRGTFEETGDTGPADTDR